jgi:hypothetical protein
MAQVGNNNAGKGKPWADALRYALHQEKYTKVKKGEALREIAKQCVQAALDGDKDARIEIGNRLDGKPHQSVDVDANVEGGLIVTMGNKDVSI